MLMKLVSKQENKLPVINKFDIELFDLGSLVNTFFTLLYTCSYQPSYKTA